MNWLHRKNQDQSELLNTTQSTRSSNERQYGLAHNPFLPLVVLLIIMSMLNVYAALTRDLTLNEHVYSEVARVVSEGGLPYRDAWDHKPPALYLYLAAFIKLFGTTVVSVRLAGLGIGLLFFTGGYLLAQHQKNSVIRNTMLTITVFYSTLFAAYETSPDYLMTALITLAFGIVSSAANRRFLYFLGGLILGIAFFSKQPAVFHLPALLLLSLHSSRGQKKQNVFTVFLGVLAIILSFLVFAISSSILSEFWKAAFATNFRYVLTNEGTWHFGDTYFADHLKNLVFSTMPYFVPVLIPIIFLRKTSTPSNLIPTILWVFSAIIGAILGRAMTFAYFSQCLPPLIFFLTVLHCTPQEDDKWIRIILSGLVVAFVVFFGSRFPGIPTSLQDQRIAPMVTFVQEHVDSDQCVWGWGDFEGDVSYFSQRRSCTRYVNSMPMMVAEVFFANENRNTYMQDLIDSLPKMALHARRFIWGYFPQLQLFADRYVQEELMVFDNLHFYAVDTTSWKPVGVSYGNLITLLGVDLFNRDPICPGENIKFAFTWRTEEPIAVDYNLFVHLRSIDETITYAQLDTIPIPNRPTSTWQTEGEIFLSETFTLHIPDKLEPGSYHLLTGLYDLESVTNLPVTANDSSETQTYVLLQEITVRSDCEPR